ncbi:MAG: enoyl-CoA hydratase/isomerase family protein [Pseudomonadota bacterium]|nr:enoyl-CoA hydratase/isomerase family protein [Pseudomonadota bacterium]
MTALVSYGREGPVGIVTLRRPPLNLIDERFLADLFAAFGEARSDTSARAIILESGISGMFCAGLDLKAVKGWSETQLRRILQMLYLDLMELQASLGKPTIAAASGTVRGGGITLSIQCDVIVADETSDFAYSEIDAGLIPAIHLSHLPRQASRHQAFTPLFGGEPFEAEKAMQLGLVERIAPGGTAGAAARTLATLFAAKPPASLKLARDAFHKVNDAGHRAAVAELIETFIASRFKGDGAEGIDAFVEKRKPRWRNED